MKWEKRKIKQMNLKCDFGGNDGGNCGCGGDDMGIGNE
jgi:hypothetical protein